MRRLGRATVAAVAASMLAATVAYAASLSIEPQDLTPYSSTTQIPTTSTCTLTSSADTYAEQLVATATHGSDTTMQVASANLANKRSFVTFDLSGCSFAATADVHSATLALYLSTAPSSSRTYNANRVTASWAEGTLNWSNQPSVAGTATSIVSTGTTNGVTLSWDVKADVKSFVEGASTNYGWRVADNSESSVVARTGTFNTRDHATTSTRPTLTITYYP